MAPSVPFAYRPGLRRPTHALEGYGHAAPPLLAPRQSLALWDGLGWGYGAQGHVGPARRCPARGGGLLRPPLRLRLRSTLHREESELLGMGRDSGLATAARVRLRPGPALPVPSTRQEGC